MYEWLNTSGSIASIVSLVVSFANLGAILYLIRSLKNKKALALIKKRLNKSLTILKRGKDIPSDMKERIVKDTDDIKIYKFMFLNRKLKQNINDVKKINKDDTDNYHRELYNKLELILNEVQDPLSRE